MSLACISKQKIMYDNKAMSLGRLYFLIQIIPTPYNIFIRGVLNDHAWERTWDLDYDKADEEFWIWR